MGGLRSKKLVSHRDDMIQLVMSVDDAEEGDNFHLPERIADAAVERGWVLNRIINSVEELEALPFGSVIWFRNRAYDKRNWLGPDSIPTGKPWSSYASKPLSSEAVFKIKRGDIVLIREPEPEEES